MATVQQLVRRELQSNPFLLEIIQRQVANVSAVAERLKEPMELELGKKVKTSAISMAIKRFVESFPGNAMFTFKLPENLEISTKSNVYEVAMERTSDVFEIMTKIGKKIDLAKGDFFSVVEGTYEIAFFTNQKNKDSLKKLLVGKKITSELDNLSYVSINWNRNTKDVPGIYYRITRLLAFKGISIQSFHTIGAEMMIFFKEEVFFEAYQTISQLLQDSDKEW